MLLFFSSRDWFSTFQEVAMVMELMVPAVVVVVVLAAMVASKRKG